MDIRLDDQFLRHPKTLKLKQRYGADAVLGLLRLWLWAAGNRAAGRLEGLGGEDIELLADWGGTPGALVAALIELRFLDREGDTYLLHNWAKRQPWLIGAPARQERARRAVLKRWRAANTQEPTPEVCPENTVSIRPVYSQPTPLLSSPLLTSPNQQNGAGAPRSAPKRQSKKKQPDAIEIWYDTEFLPLYPANVRTSQRPGALKQLREMNPDDEERERILSVLDRWNATDNWRRGYAPGPGNFFRNNMHTQEPPPAANGSGPMYQDAQAYWSGSAKDAKA